MAIMLRQINAEIENLSHEFMTPNKLLIRGEIVKEILYVSNEELVRSQDEVVPFTVTMEIMGLTPGTEVIVTAEIEHISPRLVENGTAVEQTIIIKVTVTPEGAGPAVTQQFLIRSQETLDEPEPVTTELTSMSSMINDGENESLDVKEEMIAAEPGIEPLSELAELLEARLLSLEEELRYEIEQSLRAQLQSEMEYELQMRLEEELRRKEYEERLVQQRKQEELNRYRNELVKKSIQQQINGFKAKG